jgi:hypothetical protein
MVTMKRYWLVRAVVGVAMLTATSVQAQVFTPTFTSPRMVNELAVNLNDGPGDLGVEGMWRGGPLGLRVGYVDWYDGLLSIGGEFRNPLPMAGVPLGLALTLGGQALFGDSNAVGLQGGVTAGYTFIGSGLAFTPYLHPRIGLINGIGGDDDFELEVLADVGFDLEFWTNLLVHFGVKLDDIGSNWGVSIGWRR